MTGSTYAFGWPATNPIQPTPWGLSPFGYGQAIGTGSPFAPQLQQIIQLLQNVPLQLQQLQQLTYNQQLLQQQIQHQLAYVPHQLQQAVQQLVQFTPQLQFQHSIPLQSTGHAPNPFGLGFAGSPFQAAPAGQPVFPTQPGHLM
jgi:hypothetical protein